MSNLPLEPVIKAAVFCRELRNTYASPFFRLTPGSLGPHFTAGAGLRRPDPAHKPSVLSRPTPCSKGKSVAMQMLYSSR